MLPSQRFRVFLFALILLVGVKSPALAQTGAVKGQVLEQETGDPLIGVNITVTALGRGTTTNLQGSFHLQDLPANTYQIKASFVGYGVEEKTITISSNETVSVSFELKAEPLALDQVVVSATRSQEPIANIPASVTTIDLEELDAQQSITGDLGDVIAQTAPGLGPTTGSLSNYGQTLRGRNLSVLIDGVPQSTPLRNVLRDLRTINLSAIDRVEVIRGASAAYGYGATGGMINIITKQPRTTGPHFTTEVNTRFAPTNLTEGLGGRLLQQVSGRRGNLGYAVTASYQNRGLFFDGKGDPIAPDPQGQGGLALSDEYNVLGKVNLLLDEHQQLEASANYYNFQQNLLYKRVAGTVGKQKATAVKTDSVKGEDPGTENLVLNVGYHNTQVLNGRLSARVYLQDYNSRFGYVNYFPNGGGQSYLSSTKLGTRLDVETPLAALAGGQVLWGVDALTDQTSQPLLDGRSYVPPIRQNSVAPFAQVKLPLGQSLLLRGGLRYELVGLAVDDFTTLFGGDAVEGGQLTYDALLFNLGSVVHLTEGAELFGSFSQGFSVSDIGRALRSTTAGSVDQFNPEAQTVNSYEVGLRAGNSQLRATLAGFLNTSDLGTTFGDLPALKIVQSPERIYGLEASADWRASEQFAAGGTFTYIEGKHDSNNDNSYESYLPGPRIPPTKITGYVSYSPVNGWKNRLQMLYSGSRNRFPGSDAFGQGEVDSFVTLDLQSSADLGPGLLKIGVENLLNTFYFPPISQWYNYGSGYSAGRGRVVSIGYSITW